MSPSNAKSLTANAVWNACGTVWSMLVVFLMAPFLIHRIGVEDYGLYLLLASITGMLGVVNLGLGEATLRYVAHYSGRNDFDGVNRVVAATLSVYGILATFVSAGLFLGVDWVCSWFDLSNDQEVLIPLLLRITAVTFWVRFLAGPFFAVSQGLLRYDVSAGVTIGESVVRVAGHVVVVLYGAGIVGLIAWNLLVAVAFLIANVAVAKLLVPGLSVFTRPSRRGFREVFGYGVYAFLSQLVGMAWQYADRILLAAFVGAAAVAHFAVPQEIVLRVLGLAAAAGAVLMPKFSRTTRREHLRQTYIQSTNVLLSMSIIMFVPVATLMTEFLRLWVSDDFAAHSGYVGMIVAASCLIRGGFMPYEALFRGLGKPQYYLVVVTLASMTVLLGDAILIPILGLAGAGYAYLIAPIWGIAAILFVWFRVLKISDLGQLMTAVLGRLLVGLAVLGTCLCTKWALPPIAGWPQLILAGVFSLGAVVLCLLAYELILCPRDGIIQYGRIVIARANYRELLVRS